MLSQRSCRLTLAAVGLIFVLNPCGWAAETSAKAIIPPDAKLERLWNEGEFTEGVAVAADGTVYFSDIATDSSPGRVLKFDPATGKTSVHCADSGKSNGLMFDRQGRLLAACGANFGKQALCEITPDGKVKVLVGTFEGKKFNAPNDLVVHPSGRVYFSDPRYIGPEPVEIDHMSVYRYDTDGSLHRATFDIRKPNGLAVSPDGKTLYVAETDNGSTGQPDAPPATSVRMTLNAFPINADGTLGKKRVLTDFGKETGTDGMTVDQQGNLYCAVRAASRHGLVILNPEGREIGYLPTEELPTNCCFGVGDDAGTLYMTIGTGLYRVKLNTKGFHPSLSQ